MVVIDYLRVRLRSGYSSGPGSATLLNVYMCLSATGNGTRGWCNRLQSQLLCTGIDMVWYVNVKSIHSGL